MPLIHTKSGKVEAWSTVKGFEVAINGIFELSLYHGQGNEL